MLTSFGSLLRVDSEGGPLVVVPKEVLARWTGEASDGTKLTGDYARACAVTGRVETLDVGAMQALVLGDEPMPTTWIPRTTSEDAGGLFVRWMAANSEAQVVASLAAMTDQGWDDVELEFQVGTEPLYVFDSACPGRNAVSDGALVVALAVGRYRVRTAYFRPDQQTSLVLHRLDKRL